MSATSRYLAAKFKEAFGWDNYLVIRPTLIDKHNCMIWSYDEIDEDDIDEYEQANMNIFISINQVMSMHGGFMLRTYNGVENSLRIKFDWRSICKEHFLWANNDYFNRRPNLLKAFGVHLNDLANGKYDALTNTIFKRICSVVDKGYAVITPKGILFEKNSTYKMLLERDYFA